MVKVYADALALGVIGLVILILGGAFAENVGREDRDPGRLLGGRAKLVVGALIGLGMGGMSAEFSPLDLSWPVCLAIALVAAVLSVIWVRYAYENRHLMLFVSDVHDAPDALRRLVAIGEEVAILGDLVNLTDYRTGRGAVAEVLGIEFASRTSEARARGDYPGMRSLWREEAAQSGLDLRTRIGEELGAQYVRASEALASGSGLVIHGNVDRPDVLQDSLPASFQYVHGQVVERDGLRLGFVGGGVSTPLGADGEMSDDAMESMLESLGPVDILCTHVPPAVQTLRTDVITGREERGSEPVREYVIRNQPMFHLFGDVHQPQASTWRLGRTHCVNAGYFRATGRYLRLNGRSLHIGSIR